MVARDQGCRHPGCDRHAELLRQTVDQLARRRGGGPDQTLILLDRTWLPMLAGTSLYLRPTMIATEPALGVRPADEYLFFIVMCPVGAYYPEGFNPTRIYVSDSYVRAAPGGVGESGSTETQAAAYMALQGREAWETHRDWVEAENPAFGPGIAERFRAIAAIADEDVARWAEWRRDFADGLCGVLNEGAVMALPTAPCIAPFTGESQSRLADVRMRILMMTGAAGHAGLPQISIPFAAVEGCPVGFSIVGRRGGDEVLLDLARRLERA